MRIAKVVLVFFSIGMLVSSIEDALGRAGGPDVRVAQARLFETNSMVVRGNHRGAPAKSAGESLALASLDVAEEAPADLRPGHYDLRLHAFEPKKQLSEPERLPISRLPGKWMSSAGDPLAATLMPDADPDDLLPRPTVQAFMMPFDSGRITSLFNQGRVHPAIDLAGPLGTPVHATTGPQRVTFAGWRGGYGNAVITQDDIGRTHLYGHLRSITTRVGAILGQGQKLGLLGSTGHSTGPHVHYEVRARNGQHINPVTLLFPGRRMSTGFAWTGSNPIGKVAARTADLAAHQ